MATRIVIQGRTVWSDRDFREQTNKRRVFKTPRVVHVEPYEGYDLNGNPVIRNTIETRVPGELPLRKIKTVVGIEDGVPVYETSLCMVDQKPIANYKPYNEGDPVFDENEGIVYRKVPTQNPAEGWATTDFYQNLWDCDHATILRLVKHGLVDASIRQGSQVRRYRCRDNRLVLESGLVGKPRKRR